MIKSKLFKVMGAVVALTMLSSCIRDDDKPVLCDQEVRFTAGVKKQDVIENRAVNAQWAAGDEIGVFMVENGTTHISRDAENKKYETTGGANGAFSASSDADKIYYPQAGKVDFICYYPWKEAQVLGDYNVAVATIQTTANQPSFDLLYAVANNDGKGFDKSTTGSVELTFEHKLSNLILNCKADASIGVSITDMTVSITGMNTQTTFDLATGRLSPTQSTPLAITPRRLPSTPAGFDVAYDAIILPRRVDADGDVTVEFTIGGDLFVWKVPGGTEFEESTKHIYEITITRTGITFTARIEPWIEGAGGQGVAE